MKKTGKKQFTTAKLVEYLNETHGKKKSGTPFTTNDIQQYLRRGKLPVYAGGHPLELVRDSEIGTRVIEVNFDEVAPRKPKVDE